MGYETIMVNCNPETVSTDYDTSDRLYFEPLTFEDVMNIVERERPMGVIVTLGGQTPLKLAIPLEEAGVTILGTPPSAIDRAEDRELFGNMLKKLEITHPTDDTATSVEGALAAGRKIGYPVLVRPSYVLGGRAMEIVYNDEMMEKYIESAVKASPEHPVLIDKFLEDAKEIDVDAICDGKRVFIGAIMQHIEEAGIHSGDSACVIPPPFLGEEVKATVSSFTERLALELGVVGLINVQYAVKDEKVYVLEVNPRAQPYGAVRQQVDRRAARQDGHQGHAGPDPRRAGPVRGALFEAQTYLGKGSGPPVRQIPGRGHCARARR